MKHLIIVLSAFVLAGCQQKTEDVQPIQNDLNALTQYRAEKDSMLKIADWSPIKENEKSLFDGLNYYPFNSELRFNGPIKKYDDPQPIEIYATKTGDARSGETFGYFPFEFNGAEYRLEIMRVFAKNDTTQSFLFLGFTDATTGNETYGAGRYIDLEENDENHYVVDFNYAYNPYCAYNEKYSCALPPASNKLPFPVLAGEKIYREH